MSKNYKLFALILLFGLLFILSYEILDQRKKKVQDIPYSKFLDLVEKKGLITLNNEKDKPLSIKDDIITGYYFDQESSSEIKFKTLIPYPDFNLIAFLRKHNIQYFQGEAREYGFFMQHILPILPYLIIFGVIFFFMFRQLQSTGSRALNFGKSRAKLTSDDKNPKLFKDVAGAEEAKEDLAEVVEFLKEPSKFQRLGARIPKGILLIGPPGTGKTLLARAVSGEAKVPFFSISGSDFVEMFVGVGASRVRDLFAQAKKNLPCIIFVDEIDAVGRLRGAGLGGGHDEREQTLNQLLVEMDGFEENKGLIMIAATNRSDVLDPALLRPGRFDRQIIVDPPDLNGREQILKIHAREILIAKDVILKTVAKGTPGFTGADLANLVNEAALFAARYNKKVVEQADFEEARDKVLMGPERKSCYISPEEKEIIAYHEAGHAMLGVLLENGEPVHRVTIIPRGRALGVTQQLPDEERYMRTKNYWLDSICILMGGRIAESLKFKDITTGASNDIERATTIIRKMITEWGMSEVLGPIRYAGDDRSQVFLGRDYNRSSEYSDAYAELVDKEVHKMISNCYKRAKEVIQKNRKILNKIAQLLLEKETLERNELYALFPESLLKLKSKKMVNSTSDVPKKLVSSSKTKTPLKKPVLMNLLQI